MKTLFKLASVSIAALALSVGALVYGGGYYDSVHSNSYAYVYGGSGSDGYVSHTGVFTAPAGAEVDWEISVSSNGAAYGYAEVNTWGSVLGISDSTSGGSDSNYTFLTTGGDIYYHVEANSGASYGGSDSSSEADSMIVAGW